MFAKMSKIKYSLLFIVYSFANVNCQRIAGGTTVSIADYPFATSLLSNNGAGAYLQACGGSILTASSILSAASCFYTNGVADQPSQWRARVGSSNSNSGGTIYMISRITSHPDFNTTSTLANDLAVLRTTLNMALQANVVEVAKISGAASTLSTSQPVTAIGWGALSSQVPSSEQLRSTGIWVAHHDTCTTRYNNIGFTVTANMVCAGWPDVGIRGQCEGDSGSPLLDYNGAVVGVFSWAQGCAQGQFPGVNTRITPYLNWIIATATAA